jgi:hypothetical protein
MLTLSGGIMKFVKRTGREPVVGRDETSAKPGKNGLRIGLISTIAGGSLTLAACGPVDIENNIPMPPKKTTDAAVVQDGPLKKDAGADVAADMKDDSTKDAGSDVPLKEAGL